jgi:hypothetical protein
VNCFISLRSLRVAVTLLATLAACGSDDAKPADGSATSSAAPSAADAPSSTGSAPAAAELTAADLDAYAKGLARETELVRAAQDRARTATTPQARGEAQQAQWEDQTIPEGAKASGLSPDRYRAVRTTVHDTFRWLDFQGKIDGPMQLDTAHATPEMKDRFGRDPFAELSPGTREVLQAQMNRLVPPWIEYVKLTAVAG